jgi:hypothetical protein
MAKDNLFFKTLAEVHPRFHTPAAAIIVLCAWSAALTFAGKFSELIDGVVFIGWIFYRTVWGGNFSHCEDEAPGRICHIACRAIRGPDRIFDAAAAVVGNAIFLATKDPNQFRHVLAA